MNEISVETLRLNDRVTRLETLIEQLPEIHRSITRLDDRIIHLDERMASIEARVSGIEHFIKHLPTTWQLALSLVTAVLGTAGMMMAALKILG